MLPINGFRYLGDKLNARGDGIAFGWKTEIGGLSFSKSKNW